MAAAGAVVAGRGPAQCDARGRDLLELEVLDGRRRDVIPDAREGLVPDEVTPTRGAAMSQALAAVEYGDIRVHAHEPRTVDRVVVPARAGREQRGRHGGPMLSVAARGLVELQRAAARLLRVVRGVQHDELTVVEMDRTVEGLALQAVDRAGQVVGERPGHAVRRCEPVGARHAAALGRADVPHVPGAVVEDDRLGELVARHVPERALGRGPGHAVARGDSPDIDVAEASVLEHVVDVEDVVDQRDRGIVVHEIQAAAVARHDRRGRAGWRAPGVTVVAHEDGWVLQALITTRVRRHGHPVLVAVPASRNMDHVRLDDLTGAVVGRCRVRVGCVGEHVGRGGRGRQGEDEEKREEAVPERIHGLLLRDCGGATPQGCDAAAIRSPASGEERTSKGSRAPGSARRGQEIARRRPCERKHVVAIPGAGAAIEWPVPTSNLAARAHS